MRVNDFGGRDERGSGAAPRAGSVGARRGVSLEDAGVLGLGFRVQGFEFSKPEASCFEALEDHLVSTLLMTLLA